MGLFDFFKKQRSSEDNISDSINEIYLKAEQANLLNDKAYEFYENDEFNEGIDYVKKALDLIPNYPPYLDTLANGYLMTGEYELAISSSNLCINIDLKNDSETSEHYMTRSKINIELGKPNEAIEDLKKVLGFWRDDDEALELLQDLLPLSEIELENLLDKLTSERAQNYLTKAKLFLKQGKNVEAIENLQNIIDDIGPGNEEAFELLMNHKPITLDDFKKIKASINRKVFHRPELEINLRQVSSWIENFNEVNFPYSKPELIFLKIQLSLVLELDQESFFPLYFELFQKYPDFEPDEDEVLGVLLFKEIKEPERKKITKEIDCEDNSINSLNTNEEENNYQIKEFNFYDDSIITEIERQEFLKENNKVDVQELFDLDEKLSNETNPKIAIEILTTIISKIPLIKGVSPVAYALSENSSRINLEEVYALRARWYFYLEMINEAKDDFSMAISVNPKINKSYLYHYLGICKMKLNEYDSELMRAFDMAIYFNNDLQSFYKISDSYYQRATLFVMKGENEKAKEDLIACLKLSPEDESAKNLLDSLSN
jgi:tetratricopeptide (TPR) repeat protein